MRPSPHPLLHALSVLALSGCLAALPEGAEVLGTGPSADGGASTHRGDDCDASSTRAPGCDGGMPDAGTPDSGPPDAGPPDAGPPDAGPPDAGPGPIAGAWSTFDVGAWYACGITATGSYCWGDNSSGQLGNGVRAASSPQPSRVLGSAGFKQIFASSGSHTCALDGAGQAFCWGSNGSGQLGDGTQGDSLVPVAVAGGHRFLTLTLGDFHSCGLTLAGDLLCWGSNAQGQLGLGTASLAVEPTPGPVTGVLEVVAGAEHTCARNGAGEVHCWGRNAFGELATAAAGAQSATPVRINIGGGASKLSAGSIHTCALTSAGTQCWGCDTSGELGDGQMASSGGPTPIQASTPMAALALGYDFSCALDQAGQPWCWGQDHYGPLGTPATAQPAVPSRTTASMGYVRLAAGADTICGLDNAQHLSCWGANGSGQLGPSVPGSGSATPVEIPAP